LWTFKELKVKRVTFIFTCLLLAIPCQARTITVDDDAPADFNTIQVAIDDSNNGDVVLVKDGTYKGLGNRDIEFKGKAIILRSENGPETCVIDCEALGRGFYLHSGEDENSVLEGVTITNGFSDKGGAIYCYRGSVTINNCIITSNSAESDGGGIYLWGSTSKITNCIITNNLSEYSCFTEVGGGGISCDCSSPQIYHCIISHNRACVGSGPAGGGIYCKFGSSPIIAYCILERNSADFGAGIFCFNECKPKISNCTIFGNKAVLGGGGISTLAKDYPEIINCILWGNTALYGPQIEVESGIMSESPCQFMVCYSNVEGGQEGVYVAKGSTLHWGTGNIDIDPCVADANNGDYHLKSQAGRWDANEGRWTRDEVTSLCIDAGDPTSPIGLEPFPDGGIINMGAYGGTREASKSYFGKPPCETIVAGDINGDCIVDFKDFALMAFHWLEER
jgi:parallel beta-helix repeat protein